MKRNSGFTLIELLVVISIIGILAGLSFPAIQAALEGAKKAEANAMVSQLRTAMTSYQTEYGTWPSVVTDEMPFNAGTLLGLLQGREGVVDNPRRIVFLEFNSKALRIGPAGPTNKAPAAPASAATTFVDPWNNEYQIALDTNFDGEINGPTGVGVIRSSVLVWSTGKADSGSNVSTFDKKDPKSW